MTYECEWNRWECAISYYSASDQSHGVLTPDTSGRISVYQGRPSVSSGIFLSAILAGECCISPKYLGLFLIINIYS